MAQFNERGEQIGDPRQTEWPTELKRPLSLQDEIKRFIRLEMSEAARNQGLETFEESDDFDVGEDPDLLLPTAYELTEEQLHRDASDLAQAEPPAPPSRLPEGQATEPQGDAPPALSGAATASSEDRGGGDLPTPAATPPTAFKKAPKKG